MYFKASEALLSAAHCEQFTVCGVSLFSVWFLKHSKKPDLVSYVQILKLSFIQSQEYESNIVMLVHHKS